MSQHVNWKGGRIVQKNGYIRIWIGKGKYVQEHRYVMEQFLGRKLERSEHVHHKNGNTSDNRIENLELMSPAEHSRHHRLTEQKPTRMAECHPDRKHVAKGMCGECYNLQRALEWQKQNPELAAQRKAEWHKKNYDPKKAKQKNAEYLQKNKDKMYAKNAEYRKENREKLNAYAAAYRAKKKAEKEANDK